MRNLDTPILEVAGGILLTASHPGVLLRESGWRKEGQQSGDGGGCWDNAGRQMPELKRDALGRALALACLSKPGTTFGGNNLKCGAGQPGLDGLMMANHEKSSHSGLLADKESSTPASPGQAVTTSVSRRWAEPAIRPFPHLPNLPASLITF